MRQEGHHCPTPHHQHRARLHPLPLRPGSLVAVVGAISHPQRGGGHHPRRVETEWHVPGKGRSVATKEPQRILPPLEGYGNHVGHLDHALGVDPDVPKVVEDPVVVGQDLGELPYEWEDLCSVACSGRLWCVCVGCVCAWCVCAWCVWCAVCSSVCAVCVTCTLPILRPDVQR